MDGRRDDDRRCAGTEGLAARRQGPAGITRETVGRPLRARSGVDRECGSRRRPTPATRARFARETTLISTGWAYLAAGDLARAVNHANLALAKSPRSLAAITLLVHADIMQAGALTGLDRYEQWLGGRAPDDGYLLRHVARASLLEIWRSPDLPSRVQALKHLSKDGDADARAELTRQAYKGGITELRCLAELGDEGAVRQLIGVLKQSSKQLEAAALIAQYSRTPRGRPSIGCWRTARRRSEFKRPVCSPNGLPATSRR